MREIIETPTFSKKVGDYWDDLEYLTFQTYIVVPEKLILCCEERPMLVFSSLGIASKIKK